MKINRKNNRKKIIISLISVAMLICGYLAYAYSSRTWPFSVEKQSSITPATKNKSSEQISDSELPAPTPTTKPTTQPDSKEDTSSNSIAKPNILSAKQINNHQVRVSANFSEVANGTCELTLSKPNETAVRKTADIIIVPGGYACDGFLAEVPSNGNWTAVVKHLHDNLQSNSESIEVE